MNNKPLNNPFEELLALFLLVNQLQPAISQTSNVAPIQVVPPQPDRPKHPHVVLDVLNVIKKDHQEPFKTLLLE